MSSRDRSPVKISSPRQPSGKDHWDQWSPYNLLCCSWNKLLVCLARGPCFFYVLFCFCFSWRAFRAAHSLMPLYDPSWMLEHYFDTALQMCGSPFTVGVTEDTFYKMAANSETVFKMATSSKTSQKIAAVPESRPIMASSTAYSQVIIIFHESSQGSTDLPKSRHISSVHPEPCHLLAVAPRSARSVL